MLLHDSIGLEALIDALFQLDLSISYDRIQEIRKSLAEEICKLFMDAGEVWDYSLPKKTSKAYGFDNANKISKSTTASRSGNFNGTLISVFSFSEGQGAIKLFDMKKPPGNKKFKPSVYYTNIQPMAKDKFEVTANEYERVQGDRMRTELYDGKEAELLAKVVEVVNSEELIDKHTIVSWAAFHAGQAPQIQNETVQSQILSVFTEALNTLAMVKHFLTVILSAHSFTNPGETPWVTAEQPLFALLKIIQ